MRVLVTGASGFVGREIVAECLRKNHEVYCFVRQSTHKTDNLPNIIRGDISDSESLLPLENLQNIDVIIHSAGLAHQFGKTPDEEFWRVNVKGTENIVHQAVSVKAKHFILISSVSVYGDGKNNSGLIDEDSPCKPQSVYARSKFEAEKVAAEGCEKNAVALTILRLATVIGENDRGNTARLIESIDRKRFIWIGTGENRKSLIYKTDAARACLKVLEKKTQRTEIFNVTGEPVKMNSIVAEIAGALDRKIPKLKVPTRLLKKVFDANSKTVRIEKITNLAATVKKWIAEDVFSGEKIAESYGFLAETPIPEAIRRQVRAYQEVIGRNKRK